MDVRRLLKDERGVGLLEMLVALALMGIVSLAFLSGLATETKAAVVTDEQTTAESLARSELEYAKKCDYVPGATSYPVDPTLVVPSQWAVLPCTATPAHASDDGLQKLTVTVQHNDETVLILQGYKRE